MSVTYTFPRIEHIDDVLPHIDSDCFRVVEKDSGHTFVNYVKMGNDTFPPFVPTDSVEHGYTGAALHNHRAAVRRECRGIAFDTATGRIVSRPFHKFFNVGEREDMDLAELDFSRPHTVQDKIDGSMVRPLMTASGIRWGTKMGITDTAMFAELFVEDNLIYNEFAAHCMAAGMTPIFEFTAPENRVVVDYGRAPQMTLLAIRNNVSGGYLEYDNSLMLVAERWGIPLVRTFDPVDGDPIVYLSTVKDSGDLDEGVVIQWENGHRAKIKTDVYSHLHRVKEAARTERTLVAAILDGSVDDLLPLVPVEDRAEIEAYNKRFWLCLERLAEDIRIMYREVRLGYTEKKDFAVRGRGDMTSMEASVVFALWNGKTVDAAEAAKKIIRNGLISETKWREMKENLCMATNLHDFSTVWQEKGDFE